MAVNWSLLQPVDIGGMFTRGYEQGQQMVEKARVKSALAAFSADPTNPQAQSALAAASPEFAMKLAGHNMDLQEKAAERARIGAYFDPSADLQSRRQAAASAGDMDVFKALGEMDDDTRKRATEEAKGAAPIIYEAQKLPYEQRKAFLRSQAPALARVGFTADEIEAYDPSDANNAGIINIAKTVEQAEAQDKWTWIQNPDGSRFAVDSFGRPVGDPTGRSGGGGASAPPPVSTGAPGDLTSFQDPGYDAIEARLEQKYNLPKGLMQRIRVRGEQSNAGQVSSAGAQTVYQVTPETRKLFMDKYGVDAYSSPEAAAEVAALHLSDSIARGEDPVRGYIGGPDKSQWGPQTEAYANRVGPVALPSNPIARAEKVRADAHEAIAHGADPEAVRAAAAKMGVSL